MNSPLCTEHFYAVKKKGILVDPPPKKNKAGEIIYLQPYLTKC